LTGRDPPRRLTFEDLTPAEGLKRELRRIHNYIYANQGLPKEQAFHELLKLVFCKVYEERTKRADDPLDFDITPEERFSKEGKQALRKRLERLFEEVKAQYAYIFDKDDHLKLNDDVLAYAVTELRQYSFLRTSTDVKGAAYQEVVRDNLRGDRGEFFTPDNVCRMAVRMGVEALVRHSQGSKNWTNIRVLDPAVGAGGFLRAFMNELREHLRHLHRGKSWTEEGLEEAVMNQLREVCNQKVFGLDINPLLVRAAQMNLVMHGDGSTNVFHIEGGSLIPFSAMPKKVQEELPPGSVDLIVTNPPFGSGPGLRVDNPEVLEQYELTRYGIMEGKSRGAMPPEQLFLERAYQWLAPGGVLAIVLPDSILSNPGLKFIREWLLEKFVVVASVDLPVETFVAFGGTGTQTSVLVLRKKTEDEIERERLLGKPSEYEVFMAVPRTMGYDRRGNDLWKRDSESHLLVGQRDDEVSEVAEVFTAWLKGDLKTLESGYLALPEGKRVPAFVVKSADLEGRLDGSYHRPQVEAALSQLKKSKYPLVRLKDIARYIVIPPRFKRHYVEAKAGVPFLRPSDLATVRVLERRYIAKWTPELKHPQIHEGEILVSTDGRIGVVGYVTKRLDGWAGSNNLGRIMVDPERAHPGYVLAFLMSPYGQIQLKREIFGGVIDHLEVKHLENVLIPLPPLKVQEAIGEKVLSAYELRDRINSLENEAIAHVEDAIESGGGQAAH